MKLTRFLLLTLALTLGLASTAAAEQLLASIQFKAEEAEVNPQPPTIGLHVWVALGSDRHDFHLEANEADAGGTFPIDVPGFVSLVDAPMELIQFGMSAHNRHDNEQMKDLLVDGWRWGSVTTPFYFPREPGLYEVQRAELRVDKLQLRPNPLAPSKMWFWSADMTLRLYGDYDEAFAPEPATWVLLVMASGVALARRSR